MNIEQHSSQATNVKLHTEVDEKKTPENPFMNLKYGKKYREKVVDHSYDVLPQQFALKEIASELHERKNVRLESSQSKHKIEDTFDEEHPI